MKIWRLLLRLWKNMEGTIPDWKCDVLCAVKTFVGHMDAPAGDRIITRLLKKAELGRSL